MSKLLTGSINLSKIDKSKLFKSEKGDVFLNVAIWINDNVDNYGNIASIQQSTKKDENKIYIGNLKEFSKPESNANHQNSQQETTAIEQDDSELPF